MRHLPSETGNQRDSYLVGNLCGGEVSSDVQLYNYMISRTNIWSDR